MRHCSITFGATAMTELHRTNDAQRVHGDNISGTFDGRARAPEANRVCFRICEETWQVLIGSDVINSQEYNK